MATDEYNLVYKSDNSDILAKSNVVIRLLRLLDQIADRLIAKLPKLFKDAGSAAGSATPKVQGAAKALDAVQASASAAAGAVQAAGTSLQSLRGATVRASTASQGLSANLELVAARHAGLVLIREATEVIRDALDEARQHAGETAEELLKVNDQVRELRMTKGGDTTKDQAREEVVDLMMESGADFNRAAAFDTMWESTVPAAKKKGNWGLNEKETQEAKAQALAYAVASGMDEKTIGEVVPLIAASGKVASKEDLLGKIGVMGKLAVEGVGNLTPMMKVYERLRGDMVRPGGGGAFRSDQELMGAISASSVNAGNVPAVTTAIRQVWRDLSFADNADKEATFEKYDIRPGDDYQTRLRKIAPLVQGAQAQGMTELEALHKAGFRRTQSNPKIAQAVAEQEVLDRNLDLARQAPDGKGVMAENARFKAENLNRFAEAAKAKARLDRGKEMDDVQVLRKFAEAGLERRHEINTFGTNVAEQLTTYGRLGGLLGETGRNATLDAAIRARVRAAVPGIEGRNPRFGEASVLGIEPAEGAELEKGVDALTPAERKAVFDEMERFGKTNDATVPAPGRVPARRGPLANPAGAAAPIAPGAGPQANAGGVPGGPLAANELQKQTILLSQINAKLDGGGPARPRPVGPLRPDVDDGGNVRS